MMQRNISEAVRAANVLVRTSETYRVDHNVHGDWRHGSTRSDESSFSPWYVEANKRLFEWNARADHRAELSLQRDVSRHGRLCCKMWSGLLN